MGSALALKSCGFDSRTLSAPWSNKYHSPANQKPPKNLWSVSLAAAAAAPTGFQKRAATLNTSVPSLVRAPSQTMRRMHCSGAPLLASTCQRACQTRSRNPHPVSALVICSWSCGVTASTLDSESSDCSLNPCGISMPTQLLGTQVTCLSACAHANRCSGS